MNQSILPHQSGGAVANIVNNLNIQSKRDEASNQLTITRPRVSFSLVKSPKANEGLMNKSKPVFQNLTPRSVILRNVGRIQTLPTSATNSPTQTQNKPLEKTCDQLAQKVPPTENEIDYKSQLAKAVLQIQSHSTQNEAQSKLIGELREEIVKLKSTLTESRKEFKIKIDKHNFDYSKLRSENTNLEKRCRKAEDAVSRLSQLHTVLVDENVTEKQHQLNDLTSINEKMCIQLDVLTKENANYVSKLTTLTETHVRFRTQEKRQTEIIAKLQVDNCTLDEKVNTLQTNLAEAHFNFGNLLKIEQGKCERYKMENERLQTHNLTLTDEISGKAADFETLKRQMEGKVGDCENLKSEIDRLEQVVKELMDQNSRLETDLGDSTVENNRLAILINSIDSQLRSHVTYEDVIRSLKGRINQLQAELDGQRSAGATLEQQTEEIQTNEERHEDSVNLDATLQIETFRRIKQEKGEKIANKTIQSTIAQVAVATLTNLKKESAPNIVEQSLNKEVSSVNTTQTFATDNERTIPLEEMFDLSEPVPEPILPETAKSLDNTYSEETIVSTANLEKRAELSVPEGRSERGASLDSNFTDETISSIEEVQDDDLTSKQGFQYDSADEDSEDDDIDVCVDGIFGDDKVEKMTRKRKRYHSPSKKCVSSPALSRIRTRPTKYFDNV